MDFQRSALTQVVECDTHQAYVIDHVMAEDVVWSDALPTEPDAALEAALADVAPELAAFLRFERNRDTSDTVEFVGRFEDGSLHSVITLISAGSPPRWAVVSTAVCTLEEVPDLEEEEEDDGDPDVLAPSPENQPPV